MTTVIFGVMGKMRHGKDTFSRYLADACGHEVHHYSFGEELKREVDGLHIMDYCLQHGLTYEMNPDMTDPFCATRHGKQRRVLQHYGMAKREEDSFYWVKRVAARIKAEKPKYAIISDVRFPNEVLYIKSEKGYTVRVVREGYQDDPSVINHVSEQSLEGYTPDYEVVCGEGELQGMQSAAAEVFNDVYTMLTAAPTNLEVSDGLVLVHN